MAESFGALSAQQGGIVFRYNSRDCKLFLSNFSVHLSVGLIAPRLNPSGPPENVNLLINGIIPHTR